MWSSIKLLWRLAMCRHRNTVRSIVFEDSTDLSACTRCGRVLWIADEGTKRHNPHLIRDRLRA